VSTAEQFDLLDEHLTAAGVHTSEAIRQGVFVVDDLSTANWAVRRVARHRRKLAEVEALVQAERDRLDAYLAEQRQRYEQHVGFLADLLERFHRERLADDPTEKTITLPTGVLKARKLPGGLNCDAEALPWLQEHRPELVRTRLEVDLVAAKREFVASDGLGVDGKAHAVDPETGEVVPGVFITPGEVRFTVDTKASE